MKRVVAAAVLCLDAASPAAAIELYARDFAQRDR